MAMEDSLLESGQDEETMQTLIESYKKEDEIIGLVRYGRKKSGLKSSDSNRKKEDEIIELLRKEIKGIRHFHTQMAFLPFIEWSSLVWFWLCGCNNWVILAYATMAALYAVVMHLKIQMLRTLQDSAKCLRIGVGITLGGQVGGFAPKMIKRIFGKSTAVVLVGKSLPAFLSGASSFMALPKTLGVFKRHPEINSNWESSWHGVMPITLAEALSLLLIIMTIAHVAGFYFCMWKVWLKLNEFESLLDENTPFDEAELNEFHRFSYLTKIPPRRSHLRSSIWHSFGEAAVQANLLVVAQASDAMVQSVAAHVRAAAMGGGSSNRRLYFAVLMKKGIEQRGNSGVMSTCLRIGAYAEVLAWLKISTIADGFAQLGQVGRIELLVAIVMGLSTVALSIPDQSDALRGSTTMLEPKALLLTLTLIMLFVLLFRLFAAYFVCESHIFNFTEMGCYGEATPWEERCAYIFMTCLVACGIVWFVRRLYMEAKQALAEAARSVDWWEGG